MARTTVHRHADTPELMPQNSPAPVSKPKPAAHRIHRDFRLPILLRRYSQRRRLWWSALALGMIACRVALLPLLPVPEPVVHDEFSYLLSADTFAHGRVTNPTPPDPQFFESPHVLVTPVYASRYQPGQGLTLALGQKIAGHAYWGVALSCALMVYLFCWAADAWLPPQWSLIAGGLAAVLFFIPSYWFTSYWGGAVAACGGALVVGSLGYLLRGRLESARFSLAGGALILYATRPYEGGVLFVAVLTILAIQFWKSGTHEKPRWLRTVILPNVAILLVAIPVIGWYNTRVTGHPTDLAYFEYARKYDPVPVFWTLPPLPPKQDSNVNLHAVHQTEIGDYQRLHNARLPLTLALVSINIFLNGVWLQFLAFGFLLIAVPWARMRKRKKWLVLLLSAGVAALLPEVWVNGHYTAPYTIVELILIVAAARALWYRIAASRARGLAFVSLLIVLLVPLAISYAGAIQAHPTERGRLVQKLRAQGGRHLVFVDYAENWDSVHEWVYNGANLDASPVIFAHLLSPRENRDLLDHFPGRTAWLVRLGPQVTDVRLERYDPPLAGVF
jgi:hypothetical protein